MNLSETFDRGLLEGRDILILSDAFPPYADGGAELSLNASLNELHSDFRKRCIVLSFSRHVCSLSTSEVDQLLVMHAPEAMSWPFQHFFQPDYKRMLARSFLSERNLGRFFRLRTLLFSKTRKLEWQVYQEARQHPKGGILTDYILDERDARLKLITRIIEGMERRSLLLSDNTRSVLFGGEINQGPYKFDKSVAIIRDNRFHCPRPTQSRVVNGKICISCQFQCAPEDVSSRGGEVRKAALESTRRKRHDAILSYDQTVTTSFELVRHISRILPDTATLERIPNGVESLSKVSSYTEGVRTSVLSRVAIIGMLNENKGQLEFVLKCGEWLRTNSDIQLVFCGRGERIQKGIIKEAERLGILKQIEFKGYLSRAELYSEIKQAKLILAPTTWPEPFGRVPLEAGICSKVVVAFGVGGLNESIVHGETGWLAPPQDYRVLEQYLERTLNDPEERTKMERKAFDWITERYSRENTSRETVRRVFGKNAVKTSRFLPNTRANSDE